MSRALRARTIAAPRRCVPQLLSVAPQETLSSQPEPDRRQAGQRAGDTRRTRPEHVSRRRVVRSHPDTCARKHADKSSSQPPDTESSCSTVSVQGFASSLLVAESGAEKDQVQRREDLFSRVGATPFASGNPLIINILTRTFAPRACGLGDRRNKMGHRGRNE